jgi:hypothetical protein
MEFERVPAPEGLSPQASSSELRVAPEDADWALAEGREALLRAAAMVLTKALAPDERVRLVSKAFASKGWPWARNSLRRAGDRLTLVATDRRILLVHVNGKGRPSLYANQIPYTAIRRADVRLFGTSTAIETGDGVITLRGMRRKLQDRLVDILDRDPNTKESLQPLCPSCLDAQRSTSDPCTSCGAQCKSARTAALRSFVFPGLGDIYLGMTLVGAVTAIVAAVLWLTLLAVFLAVSQEGGPQEMNIAGILVVAAILFVVGHGGSALATAMHARRARFSSDLRLPTGSASLAAPQSVAIVPADVTTPEASALLAAATAKKEPLLSRLGRPVLAVIGSIAIFLVLVVGLGLLDAWAASEVPLVEADYLYIPTAYDLGEWLVDFEPNPELIVASKTIYVDGSYAIDFEYDDPEDLFLASGINVERKSSDALTVYGGALVAYEATYAALDDVELEHADEFFQWGDRSTHVFLTSGGEPFGQFFLALQGRIVFSFTISGVYFDQPADFEEFLLPRLEQIVDLASQPHQRPPR